MIFRRVFLRRADALNDQEAKTIVGQSFQQRAHADEERRAEAQIADGLARIVAAAGDEAAKEVDGRYGKGELRDQFAQVRLVERPLVSKNRFQEIDLRARQTGKALRQLFRIGAEERFRVELASGKALQE